MKLRKILASVAAFAIAATAFSSVVMANSYGAPKVTVNVEGPSDYYNDGGIYFVVTCDYEGFEDFTASYSRQTGTGLTSIGTEFTYNDTDFAYEEGIANSKLPAPAVGANKPSIAWGVADASMVCATSMEDYVTFVFSTKDETKTAADLNLAVAVVEFAVTKAVRNQEGVIETYGNTNASTAEVEVTLPGSSEPVEEYVNVTTDGNVNGVDDGQVVKGSVVTVSAKTVDGKTAQLYANGAAIDAGDYTVNEDTSFTVVYTDIPVVSPYTYKVADYGKNEAKSGIFYALAIKNSENVMTLGVAGKAFTATDVPVVEGDTELTMTYVILGVPANLLTDVPSETTLTGAVNGAYELAE